MKRKGIEDKRMIEIVELSQSVKQKITTMILQAPCTDLLHIVKWMNTLGEDGWFVVERLVTANRSSRVGESPATYIFQKVTHQSSRTMMERIDPTDMNEFTKLAKQAGFNPDQIKFLEEHLASKEHVHVPGEITGFDAEVAYLIGESKDEAEKHN